jgi:hypothetical protein
VDWWWFFQHAIQSSWTLSQSMSQAVKRQKLGDR